MADTALIFSIFARDHTSKTLKKIENAASSFGKTAQMALGPALLPAAAVGVGAVMSLGVALAGAGAAAGVFGAVAKATMTEVKENATKVEDLTDKMALYKQEAKLAAAAGQDNSKYLAKQADAALELKARLANLPPETRKATMAFIQLKSDWQDFVDQNKPATFSTMTGGYKLLGQAILHLQPFFDAGNDAAGRLIANLTVWVKSGGIDRIAKVAGPALDTLTGIIINVTAALGGMFGKVGAAQGQGILEWIEQMTWKWREWATATKPSTGVNVFIDYMKTNGPHVIDLLTNLAVAAMNIAKAVTPLAPISLAIALALSSLVAAVPPDVITALVAGFIAFNIAMKALAVVQAIVTAAQWAWNFAQLASPTTWIILGVIALVAIIVVVATKTRFFQTVWNAVWGFMKTVGAWFAGPFANFFVMLWNKIWAMLVKVKNAFVTAFNWIKGVATTWVNSQVRAVNAVISGFTRVVNFVRSIPSKIRSALSSMFNPLWSGFKGAANRIISGWNSLHFGIPGFKFAGISFPGMSVNTPNIPYLDKGAGMVQQAGLAVIHRGEKVTPAARVTPFRSTSEGRGGTITLKSDGSRLMNMLLEILREAIRDQGGDPVKVLTPA